jgi:hypothetical protein
MLIDSICDRAIEVKEWTTSGVWTIRQLDEYMDDIEALYRGDLFTRERSSPPLPKIVIYGHLLTGHQTAECTITRTLDHFSKDMWNLTLLKFCVELISDNDGFRGIENYFSSDLVHAMILRMLNSKKIRCSKNLGIRLAFIHQVWGRSDQWRGDGEAGIMDRLRHIKSHYHQKQQDMISGLLRINDGDQISRRHDEKVRFRSRLLRSANDDTG